MRRILNKLKNNDGASILMALFAFVVASVVSMLLVNAALTSANAAKRQQEYTQAYLSVQSAAVLLDYEIRNGEAKFKVTETIDGATTEYEYEELNTPKAVQGAVFKKFENKLNGDINEEKTIKVDIGDIRAESGAEQKLGNIDVEAGIRIPDVSFGVKDNWDFEVVITAYRAGTSPRQSMASTTLYYTGKRGDGGIVTWNEPATGR